MIEKIRTTEIEIAVAEYFGISRNLTIPNVSWGFRNRSSEKDLVVITSSNYIYEIEIKVSKSDLIRDKQKHKWKLQPYFNDFRKTYFAIPIYLLEYKEHIPEFAGIITVEHANKKNVDYWTFVQREAKINKESKKITEKEKYQLARLGALRVWGLKKKLLKLEVK